MTWPQCSAICNVTSLLLKIFWVAMIIMVIVSWIAPGSHNPAAELAYQIAEGKQGLSWQLSKGKLTLNDWHLQRRQGDDQRRAGCRQPQQGSAHTYGGSKLPPGAAASVARLYHVSG